MINSKELLTSLQKRVTLLEDDLRARCESEKELDATLQKDYEAARDKGRTGLTYKAWRDDELTQIAVAWILAGVFVRFIEDNELIETPLLAGASATRHQRAHDEHSLFFRQHPTASERNYFEHVFTEVGRLPGMKEFFARKHNPLWRVGPTADAAKSLLEFWRKTDPDTGHIVYNFTDVEWDTRFLGDLYQDLSEFARKRFALLQTPGFVEQFILDRTLIPAIQTFGWRVVRMIDLTCGSGHFLLGGFQRLFRLWEENELGENPMVLAQHALDQVYGVDLNPNVVAIARFRLLLAALRASGVVRLKDAPDFRINIATGDSLLHGSRFPASGSHEGMQQTFGGDQMFHDELKHFYESEDFEELHRILGQQYHVVVGNPPYITVQDAALNQAYRRRFDSCFRAYSLVVPFMERFFDMALTGDEKAQHGAGYVGMICSNSFMKREFGKKLIEEFVPRWDLTHVIDTAGAYIPGHGTPTVILFGKHQKPVSPTIRTVMGIRGEPSTPNDPAKGLVWTAILKQVDQAGSQGEFVSAGDSAREQFHKHPWSIGGGGAAELKEAIEQVAVKNLADADIGFGAVTREDEVYRIPATAAQRSRIGTEYIRDNISGEQIRDWDIVNPESGIWPYATETLLPSGSLQVLRFLWPWRNQLCRRVAYGITQIQRGLAWFEYSMFFKERFKSRFKIAFASVATHNHFVLDRWQSVFKDTAPFIILPSGNSENSYIELVALLNSSTACFWLKQVCQNKGSTVDQHGARQRTAAFEDFFQYNTTKLAPFPIPSEKPTELAHELDRLVQELRLHGPKAVIETSNQQTRPALEAARQQWSKTFERMIAMQEELDWECYHYYNVTKDKLVMAPEQVPALRLGERAFEIVMARKMATGEMQTSWFDRHRSVPITELPRSWSEAYRDLVQRRIALIESDRNVALLEQPEYKRRWNMESWEDRLKQALREWLLNRLEGYFFEGSRVCTLSDNFSPAAHGFVGAVGPSLVSTNQLAAVVEADTNFLRLAEVYSGNPSFSVSQLVRELVEDQAVPFLPFQRYKESGLRKRRDWEHVWNLQRREDEIDAHEKVDELGISEVERKERRHRANLRKRKESGDVPLPPKYTSSDFRRTNWWRLRGKLDVPKERWIVYPGAEREGDLSPVIAWAGWDHLQQAKALAEYYVDASQNRGWTAGKLKPLLAGLTDLMPWLKQWHDEFNSEIGMSFGDYISGFLEEEARKQGTTVDTLNEARIDGFREGCDHV